MLSDTREIMTPYLADIPVLETERLRFRAPLASDFEIKGSPYVRKEQSAQPTHLVSHSFSNIHPKLQHPSNLLRREAHSNCGAELLWSEWI
jgi:hypothetical protein